MQVPKVARLFNVDDSTVIRWIQAKKLPASRPFDTGPWHVSDDAVAERLAADPYARPTAA